MKIAVLRLGRAGSKHIRAAAHALRYILVMMKKFIFIAIILSFGFQAYADYFDGLICEQNLPTSKHFSMEFGDPSLTLRYYKIDGAVARFGDVETDIVNYLFWNNKFYGKICAIIGNENINEILRYFTREIETLYANQPDNSIFIQPIKRKDGSWLFIEPTKVIIVHRYSVHLGQVEILCKDLWEKISGIHYREKSN